ncbi:MAG: peptidoglycan-associated lipoprotein Pal [Pseudomonadota bacterium]
MMKWRDLVLILAILVLAGCATTNKDTGKQSVGNKKTPPTPILGEGAMTQAVPCANPPCDSFGNPIGGNRSDIRGNNGLGSKIPSMRIIYFNYDKSKIRPESQAILEKHAAYITRHPDAYVRLEGHADERGSREYNLALGERRVEAAKEMLLILGAFENQLVTLSYGEERPDALEHNEEAWQLNRRVELVYP